MTFSYDMRLGIFEFGGVKYDVAMLEGLAFLPEGQWIKIVKREDGVLTLHTIHDGSAPYQGIFSR